MIHNITFKEHKRQGVYEIKNLVNGKRYIGMANNLYRRFKRYQTELKNGKSHNQLLQRAYDKYGTDSFEFKILNMISLESCSYKMLGGIERYFIKYYKTTDREFGYNILEGGINNRIGYKHTPETLARMKKNRKSTKGFKHSEESKKAISESHKSLERHPNSLANLTKKGTVGENHPWYGKHLTEQQLRKRMKLTKEQEEYIIEKLLNTNITQAELAKEFGVMREIINGVIIRYRKANGIKAVRRSRKGKDSKSYGMKRSEESKKKMSMAQMGNKNSVGRKTSEETLKKVRKLTEEQEIECAKSYLFNKMKSVDLGKKYNISRITVIKIVNRRKSSL